MPAAPTPAPAAKPPDPSRLPEDPVLAARSTQQWREHMADEERERQLGFDRTRLRQHRALEKKLRAARSRFDRAHGEAAIASAERAMPRLVAEMRRDLIAIDHWGVNSHLLSDYQALFAALVGPYAEAARAALHGDAQPLAAQRGEFDRHLATIDSWLKEAESDDDEEHAASDPRAP
jgi:hypothetical protein